MNSTFMQVTKKMDTFDKRVDDYIAKSAAFAQPILKHIRGLIHLGCPDVSETIKWGFPHFEYKGILCSMAAFKNHCAFSFWKGSMMEDHDGILTIMGKTSMGHFGKITSLEDLPSQKVFIKYIKHAVTLNEENIKGRQKKVSDEKVKIPLDFAKKLKTNKEGYYVFNRFSISKQNDYLKWINEARTDATRSKRIDQSIAWLAEGKSRNWKYENK